MSDEVDEQDEVLILIDGRQFRAHERALTGDAIRRLSYPPISDDRDLWLEVPNGVDRLVDDNDMVELGDEARCFTSPRSIMAGGNCHSPHA